MTGAEGSYIRYWDFGLSLITEQDTPAAVNDLDILPNGTTVCANSDNNIGLYRPNGRRILHSAEPYRICILSNSWIVAGYLNGRILVWNLNKNSIIQTHIHGTQRINDLKGTIY